MSRNVSQVAQIIKIYESTLRYRKHIFEFQEGYPPFPDYTLKILSRTIHDP